MHLFAGWMTLSKVKWHPTFGDAKVMAWITRNVCYTVCMLCSWTVLEHHGTSKNPPYIDDLGWSLPQHKIIEIEGYPPFNGIFSQEIRPWNKAFKYGRMVVHNPFYQGLIPWWNTTGAEKQHHLASRKGGWGVRMLWRGWLAFKIPLIYIPED